MGRKKGNGLGKAEVRDENGEVVVVLEETFVDELVERGLRAAMRLLECHAAFLDYCAEHPEQIDD